jgi:hypothetical protein
MPSDPEDKSERPEGEDRFIDFKDETAEVGLFAAPPPVFG